METEKECPFWHTTPLHYVPHLLLTGTLYSQEQLAARGASILPRPTAARRDRRLGLADFVHLSLEPITPLLRDKLRRGYPHILIAFDRAVEEIPGAALVPFNAKKWAHRESFTPIIDPSEKAELLAARQKGRFPSAELLIPRELPLLPYARALHLPDGASAAWIGGLIPLTGLPGGLPLRISPEYFPGYLFADLSEQETYADACRAAGRLLPPPTLPFD